MLDSTSLLSFYRELLRLKQTSLFTAGDEVIQPTVSGVFQYTRQLADKVATVTCNLTETPKVVSVSGDAKPTLTVGTVERRVDQANYQPWSMTVTIDDVKER